MGEGNPIPGSGELVPRRAINGHGSNAVPLVPVGAALYAASIYAEAVVQESVVMYVALRNWQTSRGKQD